MNPSPTIIRDLAIDAALHAMIRIRDPLVSNADIQKRARTDIYEDGYEVYFDHLPLAAVELLGDSSFALKSLT